MSKSKVTIKEIAEMAGVSIVLSSCMQRLFQEP